MVKHDAHDGNGAQTINIVAVRYSVMMLMIRYGNHGVMLSMRCVVAYVGGDD